MTEATPVPSRIVGATVAGTVACVLSALVLAWRGRREVGSAALATHAPGHWVEGERALRDPHPPLHRTATASAVHWASSVFWALGYELWRARRPARTAAGLAGGAAAIAAAAALVDLKMVPHRLTPGFQEHLSRRGLAWVYGSFAVGLALGGALLNRRRPTMPE